MTRLYAIACTCRFAGVAHMHVSCVQLKEQLNWCKNNNLTCITNRIMRSSRRKFIQMTGCLTIGFSLGGLSIVYSTPLGGELPESLKNNPNINAWLEVLANGDVRVFTGKLELGQGIRTAIAQVAAEELDMPMKNVEVILAETQRTPDEGYTAGSGSIEGSAMAVRYASAAARKILLQLAANKLDTPVEQLSIENGKIGKRSGSHSLTFDDLLQGKQITDEVH